MKVRKGRTQFNVWMNAELMEWIKGRCHDKGLYIGEYVEEVLRKHREENS